MSKSWVECIVPQFYRQHNLLRNVILPRLVSLLNYIRRSPSNETEPKISQSQLNLIVRLEFLSWSSTTSWIIFGAGSRKPFEQQRTDRQCFTLAVMRLTVQLLPSMRGSAVRFRNYAVMLSCLTIWSACYGFPFRYYGFQIRHFISTNCNGAFEFSLLLLYFVCLLDG